MTIFSKIRWVASILLVFSIVLITNIIDRENFNRLNNSVTTMYEDRIVASDLIFEISRLIHDKEIAVVSNDSSFFQEKNNSTNQKINSFIESYEQTKLTEKEKLILTQLQDELKTLEQTEQKIDGINTTDLLGSIDLVNQYLYDLSKIQLQEGKQQVFISDKAKDTINLFTQGEIIFLILMGIIIQIIILFKPR